MLGLHWSQIVGQHRAVPVRSGPWDRMEDEMGWKSTQHKQP